MSQKYQVLSWSAEAKLGEVQVQKGHHEDQNQNVSHLGKNLWLIRVPPDVGARWSQMEDNSKVGTVTISRPELPEVSSSSKPAASSAEMKLTLSAQTLTSAPIPEEEEAFSIPGSSNSRSPPLFDEYKLIELPVSSGGRNNGIFAARINSSDNSEVVDFQVAGQIKKKLKAFPVRNEAYKSHLNVKKALLKVTHHPIQLERAVNCYKPVANHQNNIEFEKKKKAEPRKYRAEKDEVAQQLFKAFETHQFYSFKDLIKLTEQPPTYLKEILNEYCIYSTKGRYRTYWELKPEYRHYEMESD